MEFWLINGTEKLQLPVPPASYEATPSVNSSAIDVLGIGEVLFLGNPKLTVIPSIDSFFPAQAYSFCQYQDFPTPSDCIDLINKWMAAGDVIQYLVTGSKINLQCVISSFTYSQTEANGDIDFKLQLLEYRMITNVSKTGWVLSGALWYYFNSNGTKKTGWLLDKGKWYFLEANGAWSGDQAGTTGQSKRMECINIKMTGPAGCSIQYQVYVQNVGWAPWRADGANEGTIGKGLRIECIRIKITGAPGCSVQYQTYVQNIGWTPLVLNGQPSGTTGKSLRIEAIKIHILGGTGFNVIYRGYIQNVGWQDWVGDGIL